MRQAKRTLSFLFVSLILGLSLSIPKMVFRLQQQKRYSETKTFPIVLVELKAASKLHDCLRLVGGVCTAVDSQPPCVFWPAHVRLKNDILLFCC